MENEIQECDILYDQLIEQNPPQNLVIYGEENGIFTLSIAIASMRNHQGRIAVAYCNRNPIRGFNSMRDQVHLQLRRYHGEVNPPHFQEVANVPDFSNNWYNIERGNFPEVPQPHDVVWFQYFEVIPQLDRIVAFIRAMRMKQESGNYLVIEILFYLDRNFIRQLEEQLDQLNRENIEGYEFLGQDRRLTDQLLEYGAYHAIDDHLTLVLQKSRKGTCKESTETPDPPTMPVTCSIEALKESDEMSLFNDEKTQVVVYGDNDYTLQEALFNLRKKSSKGIIFHPSDHYHPATSLIQLPPISLHGMPLIIPVGCSSGFLIEVDDNYTGKVVCYKCPPYSRRINMKKLTSFMQDIGRKQDNDDYLLILLTRQSQYESLDKKYKETLEGGKDLEGYKFLGVANKLMEKICDHGFKDELRAEYTKYITHIICLKQIEQEKYYDSMMAAIKLERKETPAMKPISLLFQKVQAT